MIDHWALPDSDTYFAGALARDPRGFEIDHLDAALAQVSKFRTAIDGGAHVGTWTRYLADRFESVIAFEPAFDTHDCLRANVAGRKNVRLMRAALGMMRGHAAIQDDPTRQGNTGSRYLTIGNQVDVIPIDELAIKDLDFLKLDLEGYELFALKGAERTIERCKPVILIEVKRFTPPRFGVFHTAAHDWLLQIGYREVARVKNDRIYGPPHEKIDLAGETKDSGQGAQALG